MEEIKKFLAEMNAKIEEQGNTLAYSEVAQLIWLGESFVEFTELVNRRLDEALEENNESP